MGNTIKKYSPDGVHFIINLFDCSFFEFDESFLLSVASLINATPLKYVEHSFEPIGKTAILLLGESHISIHTYPEYGVVFCDVFTCGKIKPEKSIDFLTNHFGSKRVEVTKIIR